MICPLKIGLYGKVITGWALILLLFPKGDLCAEQDVEALTREVEALKNRISELETLKERLQRLENALKAARKVQSSPTSSSIESDIDEKAGKIDLGGAVRFNYVYRKFQANSRSKGGDFEFDLFRLNVDGQYHDFLVSAEYRWYSFMNVIHHGWIGYDFSDTWQGQFGITKVPFGILPFASHSWWFGIPYYIGLEDDYDMGVKFVREKAPWNLQLAFFKNGEWGDAGETERYSFDVVKALEDENEETNQLNARVAYTLDHGKVGSTELGISGLWGQLYNETTESFGSRWAWAAHLNGFYNRWNLMLEVAHYEHDPNNPAGVDEDTVTVGAFGTAFPVASKGTLLVANLSYELPLEMGPVQSLTFYDDYSVLYKDEPGFDDTYINTVGILVTAPPVYTYIDLISGKNAPFLGVPKDIEGISMGLGPGEPDADWETRFNINVGYYF